MTYSAEKKNSSIPLGTRLKEFFYPESLFGGFTDLDGTLRFYTRIQSLLTKDMVVIDFGCGRGAFHEDSVQVRRDVQIFKSKVRRVIGLDVDPAGNHHPYLDEFRTLNNPRWPLDTGSVDLIVCNHVMEHLPNPDQFFSEAARVLKVGGYLCIRTPNRWNYIALASQLVPNRQHAKILGLVKDSIQSKDVFPTLYRCNSVRAMRKKFAKFGFKSVVYTYEAEPSYLSFSRMAYFFGFLHQRWAPGFLRASIFAFGQKSG